MSFKIDWGEIIVDMVKKKDLDGGDFADCWTEDYDWTELDLYCINNFEDELVQWGLTYIERNNFYSKLKLRTHKEVREDLNCYKIHMEGGRNERR